MTISKQALRLLHEIRGEIIPAGTVLYHGSVKHLSSEINKSGRLRGRTDSKTGGGLLTEGGLIWLTEDPEQAKYWAEGPEAYEEVEPGEVFSVRLKTDLRVIDYGHRISSEEAEALNQALKIPDYKAVEEGESLYIVATRAHDSSKNIQRYATSKGQMAVIWPVILNTLGYDAYRHRSGIAVSADELEIER